MIFYLFLIIIWCIIVIRRKTKDGVYMGMAKKIKILMVEKDLTISELAEKMGTSQPNLSNKLKRDNFNENELTHIAQVLEVKYEANFVLEDGRKI